VLSYTTNKAMKREALSQTTPVQTLTQTWY